MSQQSKTLKQSISQTGTPFVGRGKFPILLLGLSLLLVAVAVFVAWPARTPISETPKAASSLAANPELMVAQRWAAEADKRAEAAFLAKNPELMFVQRYSGPAAEHVRASFLSANPEVMVAQRWATEADKRAEAAFLAGNPELMVASRHTGSTVERAHTSSLSANPALMVAGARSEVMAGGGYAAFLARNPELRVAHRYTRPSSQGLERNYLGVRSELTVDSHYGADLKEQEIPCEPVEHESQVDGESTTLNPETSRFGQYNRQSPGR